MELDIVFPFLSAPFFVRKRKVSAGPSIDARRAYRKNGSAVHTTELI